MPHNAGSRLGSAGLVLLFGGLLSGGLGAGLLLAQALAPGSLIAQAVGSLTLPLSFAIGLSAWYAAASAQVWTRLTHALFDAFDGQDFTDALEDSLDCLPRDGKALPGSFVFIPVAGVVSLLAGALIGLTPASVGFFSALVAMTALGLSYGLLLRVLARFCLLPIPA